MEQHHTDGIVFPVQEANRHTDRLGERRRIVNKENAKGRNKQKPKTAKTTPPTSKTAKESEPTIIPYEESEPQPTVAECTPFERMAAIYPKVDSSAAINNR